MKSRLLWCITMLILTGCSPTYVLRAAYEQSRILLARERIDAVIADPATDAEARSKLTAVLAARRYAALIGLVPGDSFTKYAEVDRDVLAWVLLGARRDSFELHTWWFPIVGRVPYKGFFERADAEEAAGVLEKEGFETFVRGTEAFSTLGWFNDPVLSTTLRHPELLMVNTVLHETVHTTVWVPNHVDFNESLANFVGYTAAVDFYRDQRPDDAGQIAAARTARERELRLGAVIDELYGELDELYRSDLPAAEKIRRRAEVFDRVMFGVRATYPDLRILQSINNAEIMQLKLYLTRLDLFEALFEGVGRRWPEFLDEIRSIAAAVRDDSTVQPFALLAARVSAHRGGEHQGGETL